MDLWPLGAHVPPNSYDAAPATLALGQKMEDKTHQPIRAFSHRNKSRVAMPTAMPTQKTPATSRVATSHCPLSVATSRSSRERVVMPIGCVPWRVGWAIVGVLILSRLVLIDNAEMVSILRGSAMVGDVISYLLHLMIRWYCSDCIS